MIEKVTKPALRYHGAKFRLAPWVMSYYPEHECYTESYGGAAGVLIQKPRAYAEVYNDLDGDIVNFFRVLQDPVSRAALIAALVHTPYARSEFLKAWEPATEPVEKARRICIRAQMGFGSAGATKGATGFRIDTGREYGTVQQLWTEYPETIAIVAQRMQGVLIENRPALEVLRQHDRKNTLHFIDPPYRHVTRVIGKGKAGYYRHEMDDTQHEDLLRTSVDLVGMAIICGYYSDLYNDYLKGWHRVEKLSRISAGRGTALRMENLWINPACFEALQREKQQKSLF